MINAVTKYACPVCQTEYLIAAEAKTCYRPPWTRFKIGDIVRFGGNGDVYRIVSIERDGLPGATVERAYDLVQAANHMRDNDKGLFFSGAWWCKGRRQAEPYPIDEAQELVRHLKRRLKHANTFLQDVIATHSTQSEGGGAGG